MKIVCIGAGPAGLYFAISAKRRDPGHEIVVFDRAPEGATYGWGVVYWDNLLDMLYSNDHESARQIRRASRLWREQDIRVGDQVAHLPGYGFSLTRATLIQILTSRARSLGVDVRHDHPVDDPSTLTGADVIIGADGASSLTRDRYASEFGTQLSYGQNHYLWLGTSKVFDRFMFAFEPTDGGWMWFHAYPSSASTSTFIVECSEATWRANGFAERNTDDTMRLLEKVFHHSLEGHPLMSGTRGNAARWQRFVEVRNKTWRHDNVVLLGDAAHTTHFTIGSGTRLAMIDAVNLAQALFENSTRPDAALQLFDRRARAEMETTQASARASMNWYEHVEDYLALHDNAVDFAYSMCSRQGAQPPWRYQQHLANQTTPVRLARREYHNVERWWLAARRGEEPLLSYPLRARRAHPENFRAGRGKAAVASSAQGRGT